jgi:hypothetical protein
VTSIFPYRRDAARVRWLKVTVDPKSRDMFSYQPVTVPANRTAVPAPT